MSVDLALGDVFNEVQARCILSTHQAVCQRTKVGRESEVAE